MLSKAQEEIKADWLYRSRQELRDAGLVIKCVIVGAENEEDTTKREQVGEFLQEMTERTLNEKDIITTKELWDKYDDWFRGKKRQVDEYVDSTAKMGMYIGELEYTKYIGKLNGKTVRGYRNIKWGSESSKVNDFMSKFLIRTYSGEDRVSLENSVYVYREWSGHSINQTDFKESARKYEYKLKAAVEKPYYISSSTGKKKKREGQTIEQCYTKVKWLPGAVESLNSEVLKEKLRIEEVTKA